MKNRALQVLSSIALMLASTAFVPAASAADGDFAELKAQLAQQQQQIEQLRKALDEQKKLLEAAIKPANAGSTQDRVKPFDVGQVASTSPIIPLGIPLKPAAIPPAMPVAAAAPQRPEEAPSPLQIHLGEATSRRSGSWI